MNSLIDIRDTIRGAERLLIASHIDPDGDNLGSSLALYGALKKLGKEVYVLYVDDLPEDYKFLPFVDKIQAIDHMEDSYVFIALDSADLDRLGRNKDLALGAEKLINIDHHISNPGYGDLNYIEPGASSTGELVYNLIETLEIEIDKDIASCIYTAISSDTGSFMYSNTGARTHYIISRLYEKDIDTNYINVNLYQNKDLEKFRLFNRALSSTEFYFDNKVALIEVTQELLRETNSKMEDTEGLVEEIRNIRGVELSILLKEYDDRVKVSTRSKNYFDAADLCSSFNGGGHERAAGCSLDKPIIEAREIILSEVGKRI